MTSVQPAQSPLPRVSETEIVDAPQAQPLAAVDAFTRTASVTRIPNPSTSFTEVYEGGSLEAETEKFKSFAREHAAIQAAIGAATGTIGRGQHRDSLGDVKVELTLSPNIPEFSQAGFFQPGVRYEGVGRFSNSSSKPSKDGEDNARGFALGFAGQDFLMINSEGFFPSASDTMALVRSVAAGSIAASKLPSWTPETIKATVEQISSLAALAGQVGPFDALKLLKSAKQAFGKPVDSLTAESFFTNMPIKIGNYAAKMRLVPTQPKVPAATDKNKDYLKDDLAERLKKGPISYTLELQFFESEEKTPIEAADVVWDAPFIAVGTLVLPQQDVRSAEGQAFSKELEDRSFSPAHTQAHRALGNVGRARAFIYQASADTRGACPYGF
jgi:hypothetical protein